MHLAHKYYFNVDTVRLPLYTGSPIPLASGLREGLAV